MKWYLVKIGNGGNVYDFSSSKVMNTDEIRSYVKSLGCSNPNIEFCCLDKRLSLYAWHLLADMKNYKQLHIMWIYSPTRNIPHLSEYIPCENLYE